MERKDVYLTFLSRQVTVVNNVSILYPPIQERMRKQRNSPEARRLRSMNTQVGFSSRRKANYPHLEAVQGKTQTNCRENGLKLKILTRVLRRVC